MLQEAVFTTPSPRVTHPQTSRYTDWLRNKVELARTQIRAGQGMPDTQVEAQFAARRTQTLSQSGAQ